MKTSFLRGLIGLCLLGVISCHDKTNPDPIAVIKPESWKLLPHQTVFPNRILEVRPGSVVIETYDGLRQIDSTNRVSASFDLTDPATFDVPLCTNATYAVVCTVPKSTQQETMLSVYAYNGSAKPVLSVPISQILRPVPNYIHYCRNISEGCDAEGLADYLNPVEYYGTGALDNAGNLLLSFNATTYQGTSFVHYYKLKLTTDNQQKLTLQVMSDYLYPLNAKSISTKLFQFGTQLFISHSATDGGKLVRINFQGADETVLTASYRIDNVFSLANTLYLVASTADLLASTDGGTTWQKGRTLAPAEKDFFTNCSASNGNLPLVAVANYIPLRRTGIDSKTDTLTTPAAPAYKLVHLNQRYYVWAKDSLYYSDNPPVVPRH